MLRLITHRIIWSVPLLALVSALSFILISLIPGNAAAVLLGPHATVPQVIQLQRQLGLDRPLLIQYWMWLDRAFHGNLGVSLFNQQPVNSLLDPRLAVSLTLIIAATLVAAIVGVALGVLAATREKGIAGRVVEGASVLGLAVPNFWLALILIAVFAVDMPLLPATGFVSFGASPRGWAESLILPVIALSFAGVTFIAAQARDSMLDVLNRDFIRVLRANGFSPISIVFRHALRNAAIPVVTQTGLLFVGLLGGSVVVESVFALPGLGSEMVTAASDHDIAVIEGIVLYFTLIVIVVNLLVDLAYGLLDPRVRTS